MAVTTRRDPDRRLRPAGPAAVRPRPPRPPSSPLVASLRRSLPRATGPLDDAAISGGLLLVATGAIVVSTAWLQVPSSAGWLAVAGVSAAVLVLLVLVRVLPWRLPPAAALVHPLAAMLGITALTVLGGGLGAAYLGVWVLSSVHTGLFLPQWAGRLLLVPAAVLFGPAAGGWTDQTAIRMLVVVAVCALINTVLHRLVEANGRAMASLEELSLQDPLTGVANRRALQRVLALVEPGDVLVMCDLDHFKAVNDRLGHAGGDEVLVQFADAVAGVLRPEDVVARYGGEEFCLVLRRGGPAPEVVLAEVRRRWGARRPDITFSSGRAAVTGGGPASAALDAADHALYAAKAAGRDRDV